MTESDSVDLDANSALRQAADRLVITGSLDVLELHQLGAWLVVPTNRQRKADGQAVMGAGLAAYAARRWPELPARYGARLAAGQDALAVSSIRVLLVPTKDHWRQPSSIPLVAAAFERLAGWCGTHDGTLAIPALGCGLGGLSFDTVKEIAQPHRDRLRGVLCAPRA